MLKDADIVKLASPKLREILGPFGFDHVEAQSGHDFVGAPAVYVTSHHSLPIRLEGDIFLSAMVAINDVLRENGDDRVAYLRYRSPGEEFAVDEDEE
ncbi:hypothetical protein [Prosthecomicrobium hirschii]|uniref:hypothetical protein n=1 Tax=Prosthecodimorpha hirschii TaxID=665126 RepID=UPI002220249A|nr:hypothetical protein [Prosthecomicrobium hirschii]MCW1841819.1 hypothetical protein [Prosthecomicrobium hirschii]